jgi:hypothetical protein
MQNISKWNLAVQIGITKFERVKFILLQYSVFPGLYYTHASI